MPSTPLYRQIAEDLRHQIESGRLGRGQQLRAEAELCGHYQASRNTVREAIRQLTARGLAESISGKGTFVAERIEPIVTVLTAAPKAPGGSGAELDGQTKPTDKSLLDVRPEVVTEEIATRLGLPPGSDVIRRREARKIGETIWSVQATYYPKAFVDAGASDLISPRDIARGTARYLAEKLGRRETRYSDLITVRDPDAYEAQLFKLPEDGRVGVFEIFRTAYDQNDEPMRLTVTVCPTNRNRFVVNADIPDFLANG
jgi:GntR family transcriptional regulator